MTAMPTKQTRMVLVMFMLYGYFVSYVKAIPFQSPGTSAILSEAKAQIPTTLGLTSISANGTPVNKTNEVIVIRKCCPAGQILHSDTSTGKQECLSYSITSSYPVASRTPSKPFLTNDGQLPVDFMQKNHTIQDGFPQSCNMDLQLEPNFLFADRFFALESGQLLVPHRFWFFRSEDYCSDDYFEDKNFTKSRRVALLCTSNLNRFPATAIDSKGKLNLDFIQSPMPKELKAMTGKTVTRKCCDRDEIFSLDLNRCTPNQEVYATQSYKNFFLKEVDQRFFRIEPLACDYNTHYGIEFSLSSSGSLFVNLVAEQSNQSKTKMVSPDNYCVDDFFITDEIGLPRVYFLAHFCSAELLNPIVPDFYFFDPSLLPNVTDEEIKRTDFPKCCPPDSIVNDENQSCEQLKGDPMSETESIVQNALKYSLAAKFNFSATFNPNTSLRCGFKSHFVLRNFDDDEGNLLLEPVGESDLTVSMHYYRKQVWNYKDKINPFCVDVGLVQNPESVHLVPRLFYCEKETKVKLPSTIMLIISSIGLIATIIIYFLVPISGSAKFVTAVGGGKKKRGPTTMAMVLTGRILMCHLFTLTVAFICLIISQLELVKPATSGCVALGYITYGSFVASFAWLSVYCFDYFRIFRGSFKVSNDMLFLPYSAFGWGIPVLLMIVTAIVQFKPSDFESSSVHNPNIGIVSCWFTGGTSALFFFYLPMSILLLLNIAFFTSLMFNRNLMNCWKKKQKISLRNNQNVAKSKGAEDAKMAIKLFFITGIPWIFEIMAWAYEYFSNNTHYETNYTYIFQVTNLFNYLRGIIVFIVFVLLQRDVRRYMVARLGGTLFQKNVTQEHTRTNENNTDGVTMSTADSELTSY